jgi:hypothetical protein
MTLPRFKKGTAALRPKAADSELGEHTLLSPLNAWRILCRTTGGEIGLATFYRWLSSGKLYTMRMGFRIYVPWPALDEFIKRCKAGERF